MKKFCEMQHQSRLEKITREDWKKIFRTKPDIETWLLFFEDNWLIHIFTHSKDSKYSNFIGLISKKDLQDGLDFLFDNENQNA